MAKVTEFYFKSTNEKNMVHAIEWLPDRSEPKAIIQIVHGIAEHIERYDEMAKINNSIKEIDRFITDLQMYKKNQHEGSIDIRYNDMQGKEKIVSFWIDGDFSGDSFSADILQDLFNERDRRRERLCELMNRNSPAG